MTNKTLEKKVIELLIPIVSNDKEIREYINESGFTEEEANYVLVWLISCCIYNCVNPKKNKEAMELVQGALEDMKKAQNLLEEAKFENVNESLFDLFKENFPEWYQIVAEQEWFKPILRTAEDAEDEEEDQSAEEVNDRATTATTLSLKIMKGIMQREDDVQELVDKINGDELISGVALHIALKVLLIHLIRCAKDEEPLPKFSPFSSCLKEGIAVLQEAYEKNAEELKNVNKFDELEKEIDEIVEDHYREFIKKMYKQIIRLIESARQE